MGSSVANARAPNVSIMRFTHSSWTGLRGVPKPVTAPTVQITRATCVCVCVCVCVFVVCVRVRMYVCVYIPR